MDKRFKVTFGTRLSQPAGTWTDQRELTRDELTQLLTNHKEGPKDGPCIVPATFRQPERKQEYADEIGLLVLDSDCGHTLEEIEGALNKHGYAAVIYSTHSHMTTQTTIGRLEWAKFSGMPEQYLLQRKRYLRRAAAGAKLIQQTQTEVVIEHQPCPKYRIVMCIDKPWKASDYENQETANAVWRERYMAAAAHLGFQIDSTGADPNRLFFLPRHNPGAPFETLVIGGKDIPLWDLPAIPKDGPQRAVDAPKRQVHQGKQTDVIGAFNAKFSIESILERNGYIRIGHKYLAPTSSSKMPGVSVKDGRCFSHHESDPLYTGDERHAHDAFGAYRILEHGGDIRQAIKAVAEMLGVPPQFRLPGWFLQPESDNQHGMLTRRARYLRAAKVDVDLCWDLLVQFLESARCPIVQTALSEIVYAAYAGKGGR